MLTADHVGAPLRPLRGLPLPTPAPAPAPAAVLSQPGSALNHLQSSLMSTFPGPHPGDTLSTSERDQGGWPADGSGGQQAGEGQNSLSSCVQCGQGPASKHPLPPGLGAFASAAVPTFSRQERLPFLDYKVSPHSSLDICCKRQLLYGPLPNSTEDSSHLSFTQMFIEGHYMPGTVITKITHLLCL